MSAKNLHHIPIIVYLCTKERKKVYKSNMTDEKKQEKTAIVTRDMLKSIAIGGELHIHCLSWARVESARATIGQVQKIIGAKFRTETENNGNTWTLSIYRDE